MSGSRRLNSHNRSAIVRAMIAHRFELEVKAEWPKWATLANATYDRLYPAADQKKMQSLPEGWLPEEEAVFVRYGAVVAQIQFNGALANCHRIYIRSLKLPDPVKRRFQERHSDHQIGIVLEATDRLSIEHDKLLAAHNSLREQMDRATAEIEGALGSYSMTGSLIRDWPEIEPFVPVGVRPVRQIAVRREDLNKLLGLPAPADGVSA